MAQKTFYVGLYKRDGRFVGHSISVDPPNLAESIPQEVAPSANTNVSIETSVEFKGVFKTFAAAMESYRKFIPLTLSIAPSLSLAIAEREVGEFVKKKGTARPDLSDERTSVFELGMATFREIRARTDNVTAALEGAKHLPEVMIIGLVSAYDAFLGSLLRVVFKRHEELVLTSEKSIKFSELKEFTSIEEARTALVDREIESVLRLSHHEQFSWMENRLSMKLRADLPVWPRFIELCERRNVLTHSAGVVSAQYIKNCAPQSCELKGAKIGDRLTVDAEYFSNAVGIIYEIGVKLCYVFWHKFAKEERGEADKELNSLSFNLIVGRAYDIAEALLLFGTKVLKLHGVEDTRRMMIINLANAIRLQERKAEAIKILEQEDWSATSDTLKLGAAAVKEDIEEVTVLMKRLGRRDHPSAEDYRTWPVFRGLRSNEKFRATFEDIFGEALIPPSAIEVDAELEVPDEGAPNAKSTTRH